MSLGMMSVSAMDHFNGLCKVVASRGGGLTLSEIGDAGALARELASTDPDADRVRALRKRLGLELEQRQREASP